MRNNLKRNPAPWTLLALAVGAAAGGCATPPAARPIDATSASATASANAFTDAPAPLADSQVDISYVLGHSHRRFLARAKDASCVAQAFLDRQVLRENEVSSKQYEAYFGKVSQFVAANANRARAGAQQRMPAEEDCRSPFKVTVHRGSASESFQGCRGADDGALAHLVRDGEFLLFTRK